MIREYLDKKHYVNESMDKYKDLVKSMLKKYNVDSPTKLSKENKKKFYNELDAMWKSKEEKLQECFDFWVAENKKIISEQYNSKKRNINKDDYNKILFESYIVDKKVYDIDYPVDYETWLEINRDRLTQMFNKLDVVSKAGRSFDNYAFDEYNMQLLPNWVFIDASNTNKPEDQKSWNRYD